MNAKLLIVHAGGPKAGSSALQNFLDLNSAKLKIYGLDYRNGVAVGAHYEIQSGNGAPMIEAVCAESTADAVLDATVLSYFNVNERAICSSEAFSQFSERNWTRLLGAASRTGVQLRVVYYVRNVIPFLVSSYDQLIKRHGEYQPFDQWIMGASPWQPWPMWQHGGALRTIFNVVPREQISVVHFDGVQRNIVRSFLNDLSSFFSVSINLKEQPRRVNRSLTGDERKALLAINAEFGSVYSKELSDLMIYSRPDALSEPVSCPPELFAPLIDLCQSDVDWVNKTFFIGNPTVSVFPRVEPARPVEKNVEATTVSTQIGQVERLLIDWLIRKLKTQSSEIENLIFERLAAGAASTHMEVPADFNPVEYLVLNRDVLFSGLDPSQHFVDWGISEGREYKLF